MTKPQQFAPVAAAYAAFDTPLPADLATVDDRLTLAVTARDDSRAPDAGEPALNFTSREALAESITAIALHRATAEQRRNVADHAVRVATGQQLDTWSAHVPDFHRHMAEWFTTTAARFLELLAELDGCTDLAANVAAGRVDTHTELETTAQRLEAIRQARAALQGRLNPEFTPFWRWSQIVTPRDLATTLKLLAVGKVNGPAEPELPAGSAAWWAAVAATPGATLAYHTPDEQQDMYQRLRATAVAS